MEAANKPKPRVLFEFQVEKIIDVSSDGDYKVLWAPAWVSKFHLDGCEHLIQEFLQQQSQEIKVEAGFSDAEVTSEVNTNSDNCCVELPVLAQPESRQTIPSEEQTPCEILSLRVDEHLSPHENHSVLGSTSLSPVHCFSDIQHGEQESMSQNTGRSVISSNDNEDPETNLAPEPEIGADWHYSVLDSKYQCNYCSRKFETKYKLTMHIRIHTQERPYSCDYCPYSSNQKSTLINHVRTHTGEKPFICDLCEKSFAQKSSFISHRRTHTGEKPYSCNACGKSFGWKVSLNKHKCDQR